MFVLKNVRHSYGGREVVHVDQWSVAQGEHWLLLGSSGSGKSTLLHVLAGLIKPSHGAVSIAGQNLAELPASEIDRFRGRHIGVVFQRLHLISSLTVQQNVSLARYLASEAPDATRTQDLLASLRLTECASRRPEALSFGQAQRAAIARAVINKPRLILADEPTSNLDDASAGIAVELLLEQANLCGATLVIATHDRRIRKRFERQRVLEDRT